MKKYFCLVLALIFFAIPNRSPAPIYGLFPGLDRMIRDSEMIVVGKIERTPAQRKEEFNRGKPYDPTMGTHSLRDHEDYEIKILRSLKGHLKENRTYVIGVRSLSLNILSEGILNSGTVLLLFLDSKPNFSPYNPVGQPALAWNRNNAGSLYELNPGALKKVPSRKKAPNDRRIRQEITDLVNASLDLNTDVAAKGAERQSRDIFLGGPERPHAVVHGDGLLNAKHVKVYYEKGRFGGWPANYGIWIWENEILVGYSRGYYKDLGPTMHHIDRQKPEEHWLARSLDGGETWTSEFPTKSGHLAARGPALHGIQDPAVTPPEIVPCPGGIDFTHPDFCMTLRMTNIDGGQSYFEYSYDRGKTWNGPYALPNFTPAGLAARTDYIVEDKNTCTLFLTAGKSSGEEGRLLCARTTDGGKEWKFRSWIGEEPKEGYEIMPSTVRLSPKEIYTTTRVRPGEKSWIGAYRSLDDGLTWTKEADPVADCGEGNPPALIKLKDGRLCLTYGVRAAPWRICAKLSRDGGRTWGDEIVLRDDGNDRDIGYCRSVQRPDGKVVTLYYINETATGPERYIGATIWDPANSVR